MIVSYSALGASDNQPSRHEVTHSTLVDWLREFYEGRGPGAKDGPYLVFADFGTEPAGPEGTIGTRDYAHLQASYAVPLDLDLGGYAWTADSIRERLTGYQFLAWTSYSNTAEVPRWRVVVMTERGMNADEHRGTWTALAALFANDCGQSSKDATRLNYLPGLCLHPEAAQFMHGEGVGFPVSAPILDVNRADTSELTDEPVEGWDGPEDDDELIGHMLAARSKAQDAFAPPGTPTRFEALWYADAAYLSRKFPPKEHDEEYDKTACDLALANELAYYTGSHGTRCVEIMARGALAQRDSYEERKGVRAVLRACTGRTMHAFMRKLPPVPPVPDLPPTGTDTPREEHPGVVAALHLCTDQRNAERLFKAFGSQMLSAAGEFYTWAGTHWEGGARLALRLACSLSLIIQEELKPMRVRRDLLKNGGATTPALISEWEMLDIAIDALQSWGAKCEQSSVINAALAMLKSLLDVPMSSFDKNPWLLNVRNGTLDLRTGTLHPHNPADRITRCIPHDYLHDARADRFERFLAEVFPDPRTVEYVQRYLGYTITGSNREQTMLVHFGGGSNGKNTLFKTLRAALGPYAMAGTSGLLTADKDGGMIHEIADLYGSRLVSIDETSDGARLNESSFKRVTGDDNVRGRHLYKNFFEYRPTYKLHLLTNHKPRVVNTDNGVWRRLRLLPYTQSFGSPDDLAAGKVGHLSDLTLDEALEQEMAGVLRWLIAGAARWHVDGLKMCPEVAAASAEYRREEDLVGQFLSDRCLLDVDASIAVAGMYAAYSAWAREAGAFALSKKRLVSELTDRPLAITARRIGDKNITTLFGVKLL